MRSFFMELNAGKISLQNFMRSLFSGVIIIGLISLAAGYGYHRHSISPRPIRHTPAVRNNDVLENVRLSRFAEEAKAFISRHQFNKKYCFLIDMRIASGKKRFFVYDLIKDSVAEAGMVTHGAGSQTNTEALQFSNTDHSLASSLGKYRIGSEYTGQYGLAYKLFGLEASNSNAYARVVVLHAHPLVPADEVWPQYICTSWGCPTVNPNFLLVLKGYIRKADKPVLLWIFY